MNDMDCMNRVDEMAAESLCPETHEKWEYVRDLLIKTRKSLTAHLTTEQAAWISVKDKLPDELKNVIVTVSRYGYQPNFIGLSSLQAGKWTKKFPHSEITHWMPLPEAPNVEYTP